MSWGRLSIRGGFLLLVAALIFFDTTGLFFWVALAAALHEAGHMLGLFLVGGRVQRCELSLRGVNLEIPAFPALSYGRDLIATLAGPAVSLLTAFASSALALRFGLSNLYVLAGVALTQGLFNLLPARALDGGRVLHLLIGWIRDERVADRVLKVSTVCSAGALAVVGVLVFMRASFNFVLLLGAIYAVLVLMGDTSAPVRLMKKPR